MRKTRILAWLLIALGACVAAVFIKEGTVGFVLAALIAFAMIGGGGYLLLLWAAKLRRISARFTPSSLELTAPSGHLLGGNGKLTSASIPWSAMEAVRITGFPGAEGAPDHNICLLYTSLGDFTIHSLHWERHDELIAALLTYSGRSLDGPLPSRPGGQSLYTPGERTLLTILRALGWAGLAASLLFLWFFAGNLWKNGLNWSGASMLPALATMLGGSYALTRIRTR